MRVVVFPILKSKVCGYPPLVRLTEAEAKAMRYVHLGGIEALRTERYRCTCRTVDSLMRKGLLAGNGPTPLGCEVGRTLTEND